MTIKFTTNIPQEVRLRSIEGTPVDSQFGGKQHKFSAEEGPFWVSETVGGILTDQLRKLGVRPGVPVEIVKAEVDRGNGRKGIQWIVSVVGHYPGEQGDGTLAVPKPPAAAPSALEQQLAASIAMVEARKQTAAPAWADTLVQQSCVLVDAFAAVVKHSAQYQGLVKPDDARSILLSAFINLSRQQGGRSAA